MDKLIKDLHKLVPFKDTLAAGDIVMIAAQNPQMLVYARVADIVRDQTKRDEWWHVSMYILSLPPKKVTWTLRTPQMTGMETFTMDGEARFMKALQFDPEDQQPGKKVTKQKGKKKSSLRRIK
jgi:hypothetical protein